MSYLIQRLNDRRKDVGEGGEDAGFTLIELMVVLLILAILLAIAIPTFLGVTKSADDRAAQSNLNTALTNAKAAYQSNGQSYAGVDTTTLQSAEPSLSFTTGAIPNTNSTSYVSMTVAPNGDGVAFSAWSKAKKCWVVADNTSGVTGILTNTAWDTGDIPVTQGTWYGEFAAASASNCGGAWTATYQNTQFPNA
jgi:type IV pilus assembly protein PilA